MHCHSHITPCLYNYFIFPRYEDSKQYDDGYWRLLGLEFGFSHFIFLYNKIIMMLREIMVTKCADRPLHALAANNTNSASSSPSVVSCCLSMKRGGTLQNTGIVCFRFTLLFLETDFNLLLKEYLSRDSWVEITTIGVRFPAGASFSLIHRIQTDSRAHPASYPTGKMAHCPGVKRLGRAKVKNGGAIPPLPLIN
jgi:hypothetical protein